MNLPQTGSAYLQWYERLQFCEKSKRFAPSSLSMVGLGSIWILKVSNHFGFKTWICRCFLSRKYAEIMGFRGKF